MIVLKMKVPLMRFILAFILLAVVSTLAAHAQAGGDKEEMEIRYLHVMLGTLAVEDSWTIEDGSGEETTADRDDLIYGAVVAQLSNGSGMFQYGMESGGMISFKNDTSYFIRSDGGLTGTIKVKNQMWILDMSLGGFVSFRPWRGFRLYASAGPSIVIGSLAIDDGDVEIEPYDGNGGNTVTFEPGSRETDVDAGIYGRAGFDIILDNGFVMGFSARKVNSEMDFGGSGTIKLDDTQYFLTVGQAF